MEHNQLNEQESKINSLLQLVDDPDNDIFESVSEAIVEIGKPMLEPLEIMWENSTDEETQKRIELLIHSLQMNDLVFEFQKWRDNDGTLLEALILIAKYKYPNLTTHPIYTQYEKMRRNVWLELNQYLSGLEQMNIIVGVMYNYYKMQGVAINESKPEHFYINELMEKKIGNSYSIGVLIAAIMDDLDVNIKCLELPYQFVLAHFETLESFRSSAGKITKINYYLDPNNGYIFNQRDVDIYFKKINETPYPKYFTPLTKSEIIFAYLNQLSSAYDTEGEFTLAGDIEEIINLVFWDLRKLPY